MSFGLTGALPLFDRGGKQVSHFSLLIADGFGRLSKHIFEGFDPGSE